MNPDAKMLNRMWANGIQQYPERRHHEGQLFLGRQGRVNIQNQRDPPRSQTNKKTIPPYQQMQESTTNFTTHSRQKVSANQEQKGTSSNWQGHLPEAPVGSLKERLSHTHDRTRWGWAPHHACCHCPEVLAKQARKKTKYSNRKEGMTLPIRRQQGFGVQSLTKRFVGLNGEASKDAGHRSTYKYQSHSHTTRVKKQNV